MERRKKVKRTEKVEMIAHEEVVASPVAVIEPEPVDDRKDLIEIVYGANPRNYVTEELPKEAALQKLVDYYRQRPNAVIPKNMPNLGGDGRLGQKVNQDVVYMKFDKYDSGSGRTMEVAKDVPIWIAADRIVNSGELSGWKRSEMITKEEYTRLSNAQESSPANYTPRSFTKRITN